MLRRYRTAHKKERVPFSFFLEMTTKSTSSVFVAPVLETPAREEDEKEYEEEYEEESDYEQDEKIDPSLRSQCLPLDAILPDFETEEPVDGFEYLRRVRYEAATIPHVVVSDVNPRDYDNKRTPKILEKHGFVSTSAKALGREKTMRILEHARANAEWTKQFLESFSNLRVSMRRALDDIEEKMKAGAKNINRKYITPEKLEAVPMMSDVVALDDVTVSSLFRKYCYSFTEKEDESEKEKLKHAWFFALAVRVSMPLDSETQAAVRRVSRVFAKQLSSSFKEKEEEEDEEEEEEENAGRNAALNIGLSIAWKYFNQPPFDDNEEEEEGEEDEEIDYVHRKLERIL